MTNSTGNWLEFLQQQGARIASVPLSGAVEVLDFGVPSVPPAPVSNFVAPLTDLGLIALTGEEATHFLHNQLTNDVEHLGPSEARLAGYCSPKGRLMATFLMWKTADVILLQLPRELQAALQKRLQMFVLRAKVKLADVMAEHVMLGLAGARAAAVLPQWFPAMPLAPYQKAESEAGTLIRLANAIGSPRFQWITTPSVAQDAWPILTRDVNPAATAAWRLSDIHAAIPQIRLATQEQFVPQMINYEVVGGVNFKKGCYPGQEIVARSQYLGKLKRRMMPASVLSATAKPGTEVFSASDAGQPCGMIVNAELNALEEMACLVELKVAAMETGPVHLGAPDGPVLRFEPLPYELLDPT
ncbi:folate-binding protein YgfZ [soil metagenome]